MAKSFNVNVEEVKWFTANNGIVKPVVVLTKSFSKKGTDFDSLAIHNAKMIEDQGIGAGAVLKIALPTPESIKIVSTVKKVKTGYPRTCSVCNGNLVVFRDVDLLCPNEFCGAKSRTPILKLAKIAMEDDFDYVAVLNYLNTFPTKSESQPHKVDSIIDFMQVFKDAGPKNTNFRDELLKTTYGDKYNDVKKVENAIDEKLKSGVNVGELWAITSLRGINEENIKELEKINFSALVVDSFSKQLVNLRISSDLRTTVALNKPFIMSLVKDFNALRYE